MYARHILIATPLLKWYMDHGIVVSTIYIVIKLIPSTCFDQFTENVSGARRQGDIDPYTSVIADTMELLGNSGYGSLIMNKENHQSEFVLSLYQHCFFNKNSPCTTLIY